MKQSKNELIWHKIHELSEAIKPIEHLTGEALLHYEYYKEFEGLAMHEVLAIGESLLVLSAHFYSPSGAEGKCSGRQKLQRQQRQRKV